MAGPAIRAWQIAAALSREHDVELVTPRVCEALTHPDFRVRKVDRAPDCAKLGRLVRRRRSSRATSCSRTRRSRSPSKVVVADIYDPFHLEQLEQARDLVEADAARRRALRDRRAERAARAGRLLPVREREAARLLARPARRGRPDQPGDLRRRREPRAACSCVVPFGVSDDPPVHTATGAPGRRARHRRRRQGHPLGRRRLQLVRPAHAAPRRRQAAASACPRCGCSSSA